MDLLLTFPKSNWYYFSAGAEGSTATVLIELTLNIIGSGLGGIALVADAHVLVAIAKGRGAAIAAGWYFVERIAAVSVITYIGLL